MTRLLFLASTVLLAHAAAAQTVPMPRPSPEERAAMASGRSAAPEGVAASAASRPLTEAEQSAFAARIASCWNPGSLPESARGVILTLGFELTPDAVPVAESITLVGQSGTDNPSSDDLAAAIEAGRRAILRCGAEGFDLPDAAREYWRHVQITFDPATVEGLR